MYWRTGSRTKLRWHCRELLAGVDALLPPSPRLPPLGGWVALAGWALTHCLAGHACALKCERCSYQIEPPWPIRGPRRLDQPVSRTQSEAKHASPESKRVVRGPGRARVSLRWAPFCFDRALECVCSSQLRRGAAQHCAVSATAAPRQCRDVRLKNDRR